MSPLDFKLIALAIAAVGLLVLLVTRWKVNAFISLVLASLLVGGGAMFFGATNHLESKISPTELAEKTTKLKLEQTSSLLEELQKPKPLSISAVVEGFATGMGGTLGAIAAVIALGTMLGKLLAESGGAEVLAKSFAAFFGPKRVIWCIMALAIAVGLSTWFVVGLVLLLPILLTLTRETKTPFLLLAIPLLSCLSVMHGLMPPHPGPVAAMAEFTKAGYKPDMGMLLVWGFVIGLPTAIFAGPIFARRAIRHVNVETPDIPSKTGQAGLILPGFWLTLFSVLLPVLLMLLDTATKLSSHPAPGFSVIAQFIGNPTVALLIAVLFGSWSLGIRCGYSTRQILKFTEQCIAGVGMAMLVVGAGGGFATVLRMAGVADAMGHMAKALDLSPLLYAWMVAAFIRVATGSATVAIIAASGLLAPVLKDYPGTNVELVIVAIGCGSLILSHLNDGGFWIVKDCLGLSVGQTLRTWTVTETLIGVAGLIITMIVHAIWKLAHY
jgi:GntP family gluconate:H+ symporter